MTNIAFIKSLRTNVFGMAFAQSIPLFGSLFITRIYSPDEFGIYSTWLGVVLTLAVLITGRLELSLGLQKNAQLRNFTMVVVLVTIILFSILLFLISLTIGSFIFPNLNMILLTFPAVLLIAAVHSWQSWAVAEGNFKGLNLIRVAQALIATITQILFGYIYPHPESLAFGYSLGSLIALLVGISFMPINLNIVLQNNFFFRLINFWIKHRRFPLFSLPADFMNTLSSQAPLFFISSNFGDDSAGYFALVVRVLGAPIGFLGASVLDVFKKYAASSFISKGNCHKEYIRVFIILLILSAITTIAVVFFSESLFALAFGNSWEKAGVLAIWLMPLFALRFIASPLSYVFYISGKQHIDLVWQCALFFITIIIFMNCDTFESSIKLYALCYSALYCIYILLSYKFSKGSKF